MNIINCTEEQINWVDALYLRKCGFLSERCILFWLMFSGSDVSPFTALTISQVDGSEQTMRMQ